jgi:hypothetical protein
MIRGRPASVNSVGEHLATADGPFAFREGATRSQDINGMSAGESLLLFGMARTRHESCPCQKKWAVLNR